MVAGVTLPLALADTLPTRPRLLVVDDEPSNVDTLVAVLEADHDIAVATSGSLALAYLARGHRPELILLDVMMPGMDGFAVCAALQADAALRDIPVIFVTARSDVGSEARALANGGVDFIHKPFSKDVVRARVRLHLLLRARERQLAALNSELEHRVDERTRALQDALVQARQAAVAKSNFMANMSHELRTPLAAISGYAMLLDRLLTEPTQRSRLSVIASSARDLEAIVTDILSYTAIQNGRVLVDDQVVDLAALAGRVALSFEPRARTKGLAFEVDLDHALPRCVHADEAKLERVVASLASNAVKFTEAGVVRLTLRRAPCDGGPPGLAIDVEDTGIGMSQATQSRLFEPFEQADMSSTRRYGGLGLGLALTHQLVRLMGGLLAVTSEPGGGSCFTVTMPLRPAQEGDEAGAPAG
ncbi:MAG: hypothetical protein RL375_1398 [Pseudomonadota bacterium]